MKRITIIGGGASGTLTAINILKHADGRDVELNLVERGKRIGRGVAFGTAYDSHLLNVPAGRMGALPDDIGEFHRWLTGNGYSFGENDFVPRKIYGEYLRDVFTRSAGSKPDNVRLNVIDDEAVDLSVNGDSAEVMLRSGEILPSHNVILAFGNFKPPHPSVSDLAFTRSERYFQDPWNSNLYESIKPGESIFIVGTGLSMVDVALHFYKQGHTGKVHAISTRGLLPTVHKLGFTYPSFSDEIEGLERITDILKVVRRHIGKAESTGSNWRAVIDSLRPVTQKIWVDLPLAEKRYFMQHLSRYWNVARHRMPAEAADVVNKMQEVGTLEILRGRIKGISLDTSGGFDIAYTSSGTDHSVTAGALVNCIGSEPNFSRLDSTFVQNLIKRGHIRNDDLSFGIKASAGGSVMNRQNNYSTVVYTLGTSLKGLLWETTAIPEIRVQARDLALKLLAD